MKRIIRLPAVEAKDGPQAQRDLSAHQRWSVPRQVPLGTKAVGWLEHEVDQWIDQLAAKRDGGADACTA